MRMSVFAGVVVEAQDGEPFGADRRLRRGGALRSHGQGLSQADAGGCIFETRRRPYLPAA